MLNNENEGWNETKDPIIPWRTVYIYFLLISFGIGIGILFGPAQELSADDPDYRAIVASVKGLEESRNNRDISKLSEFAANDPRYPYGKNLDLAMARKLLGKPNLRIEEIGFLEIMSAEIKEVNLPYDNHEYHPMTPTPEPSSKGNGNPSLVRGGSIPTVEAYQAPGEKAGTTASYPPPSTPAFTPTKSILNRTPAPTFLPAYLLPDSAPIFSPPNGNDRNLVVRLLGDRAYVENGDVEEILTKKNGRWKVIAEKTIHCCG